jgi:hypothetical protein
MEISPRKSLTRLAAWSGLSLGSAHTVTRLVKLQPYKITVVPGLTNPDSGIRIHFLQLAVHDGIVNPEALLFSSKHGCN